MNTKEPRRDEQLPTAEEQVCLEPDIGENVYAYYVGSLEPDAAADFEEHLDFCCACHEAMLALDSITMRLKQSPNLFFNTPVDGKDLEQGAQPSAVSTADLPLRKLAVRAGSDDVVAEGPVVEADDPTTRPATVRTATALAGLLALPLLRSLRRRKGVTLGSPRRRLRTARIAIGVSLSVGLIAGAFLYFTIRPSTVVENKTPESVQLTPPEYTHSDMPPTEQHGKVAQKRKAKLKPPRRNQTQTSSGDSDDKTIAYLGRFDLSEYENIDPSRGANEEGNRKKEAIDIPLPPAQRVHVSFKLAQADLPGSYLVRIEDPNFNSVTQEQAKSLDGVNLSVTLNTKKVRGTRYYVRIFRKNEDPQDYVGLYAVVIVHSSARARDSN